MASPARPPMVIRFGEFELNAETGELRKAGLSLKIHPQPFRVLLLLLERPGQIVSRSEIQQCLWGDNTFVDFDAGINFCIKQIRDVLADDAESPRYVETIPRRGYRFIAQLKHVDSRERVISFPRPQLPGDTSKPSIQPNEESPASREIHALHPPALQHGLRKNALRNAIGAAFLAAALIASAIVYFRRPPKLTEKDTIVLADFSNTTGDPVFDDALKQALAVELGQSPFLNVLSDAKANETLKMMGRPANSRVTPDVARELCQRTGSKALLAGSISSLGSHYVLDVNALACSTGETLAKEQLQAASKDDVLNSLSRAASGLRAKLGESLPSVQKFDVPVEATTSSLEALKYFSMGGRVASEQGDAPSVPFYQRAIELDPNFAMAYAGLAARYNNLNEPSLALEYATKAYELRDRGTERERLRISASYFRVTGEVEKLEQVLELWIADYPRDSAPHGRLGVNRLYMGQYEKALAEWQKVLQLESGDGSLFANLGAAYLALGRPDAAMSILNQAQSNNPGSADVHWMMYYLAFLQGDTTQMAQQVAWAAGKPGDEDWLLAAQSDTEAFYGRLSSARDFSRRAVDSAFRADNKEVAALWRVMAALREAEFGDAAEAKREVREALALAPGRNVKLFAALALARAGDPSEAQALAGELEKNYPGNTVLKVYRLPSVNAAIALSRGDPSQAFAQLEIVKPYELGQPTPTPFATLYPPYLRGQAYLSLHDGAAAAAEFQKILGHPGIILNFPLAPLAHLQLARAYALSGDTPKAKSAYQDFLTLWNGADPEIPILKHAKSDYARLK